jgi:hypothetical protein
VALLVCIAILVPTALVLVGKFLEHKYSVNRLSKEEQDLLKEKTHEELVRERLYRPQNSWLAARMVPNRDIKLKFDKTKELISPRTGKASQVHNMAQSRSSKLTQPERRESSQTKKS